MLLPSLERGDQRYRQPSPTVELGGIGLNAICASRNAETRRWEFIFAVNSNNNFFFLFNSGDETRCVNINAKDLFRFMTVAAYNLASFVAYP